MKKYLIQKEPFVVPTNDGKLIEEHHGIASTENKNISIAHMIAPPKWSEPFQTPQFEEYTYIIKGKKEDDISEFRELLKREKKFFIKFNQTDQINFDKQKDIRCGGWYWHLF